MSVIVPASHLSFPVGELLGLLMRCVFDAYGPCGSFLVESDELVALGGFDDVFCGRFSCRVDDTSVIFESFSDFWTEQDGQGIVFLGYVAPRLGSFVLLVEQLVEFAEESFAFDFLLAFLEQVAVVLEASVVPVVLDAVMDDECCSGCGLVVDEVARDELGGIGEGELYGVFQGVHGEEKRSSLLNQVV